MKIKIKELLVSFGYRKVEGATNTYAKPVGYGLMIATVIREDCVEVRACFRPNKGELSGILMVWNSVEFVVEDKDFDAMSSKFAMAELDAGMTKVAKQYHTKTHNFISKKEAVAIIMED